MVVPPWTQAPHPPWQLFSSSRHVASTGKQGTLQELAETAEPVRGSLGMVELAQTVGPPEMAGPAEIVGPP